ncbi:MAG: GyrI-like domain-containing protein [Anaerolineae bacterium]
MVETIDVKKLYKDLYNPPSKTPVLIEVPPLDYLMLDGQGDPSGAAFAEATQALYSVAYTLKFMLQKELGVKYSVPPMSALWWADEMTDFLNARRDNWRWTAMIMQPVVVAPEQLARAISDAARKKDVAAVADVRLERFAEGLAAQIMHLGPYSAEPPTIARLHAFIHHRGYALRGKHHEVYLSDPRRAAPEKMKTVLRQPVAPA